MARNSHSHPHASAAPAAPASPDVKPADGAITEPLPSVPKPEPVKEPEQTPEQKAASAEALKIAEDARTPAEKRMDANSKAAPGPAPTPAAPSAPAVKTFGPGPVTGHSRSFHGGQPISAKIVLPEATTEEGVFNAFLAHHPSAQRQDFRVDPENKTDAGLRTDKE